MSGCDRAVAIGASAGALDALSSILPKLPADFPAAVLVVVHLPPDRSSLLVELLQERSKLSVTEAEDKEPLEHGRVLVAPPDYHLLVEQSRSIALSSEEPVHFSRPSVDLLFSSAAEAFGRDLVGVVLTGANNDGAAGLRAIEQNGGTALVQRPDLAAASQMPQSALEACVSARALSLDEIATSLLEFGR